MTIMDDAPTTSSGGRLVDRIPVIDVDAHVMEPADLFTKAVPSKYADIVPHVGVWDGEPTQGYFRLEKGDEYWIWPNDENFGFGGDGMPLGVYGMANWHESLPSHPKGFADVDPAAWDAKARLTRMDDYGLYAQVIYPNIVAFEMDQFMALPDDLGTRCMGAYNDWIAEWCSADPNRLIPLMAPAVWDLDWTLKEIARCAELGFKGIIATAGTETLGLPFGSDPHWEPMWQLCEDLGMTVNFHGGGGGFAGRPRATYPGNGPQANYATQFVTGDPGAYGFTTMITSGVAHRHPNLNFVSVETGVGWIPYFLQYLQWHWDNSGVWQEHPEWDLTPTELFKRQMYGTFWWEASTLQSAVDVIGADNFLFETDFPHPTAVAPGRGGSALMPSEHIESVFSTLPFETSKKLLNGNAARIYHLDVPAER